MNASLSPPSLWIDFEINYFFCASASMAMECRVQLEVVVEQNGTPRTSTMHN